jgi:hypothetical protein
LSEIAHKHSRFMGQFPTYLADSVSSEDIEEIYQNAHAAIGEDPTFKPSTKDRKAEINEELTVEERNLLSAAYRNVIGTCRTSWRNYH